MIQKSRPYLVHLNLRGCLKLTSNSFVTVAGCHNIQDLNLSNCINLTVIIYDNNNNNNNDNNYNNIFIYF
jgi:hypothetical protein